MATIAAVLIVITLSAPSFYADIVGGCTPVLALFPFFGEAEAATCIGAQKSYGEEKTHQASGSYHPYWIFPR